MNKPRPKSILVYSAALLVVLYSIWPVLIMTLEGFDIDLSPIFSGRGLRYIGGVPYFSGGIFPTPVNYMDALNLGHFPRLVVNSTAIASLSIVFAMLVGVPAAYALARLRIRGKKVLGFLLLALRTVSPFAVVLPMFLLFIRTGLWDTYQGVAVVYLVLVLPVIVWVVRGFFSEIPRETYEAAALFGASEKQIFLRIALPLVVPGIIVTSIFAFSLIWNEFLIADILTGPASKTVSVGVWGGVGGNVGFRNVGWSELNAAGALAFYPAFSMLLIIRRYLAKGFSLATAS